MKYNTFNEVVIAIRAEHKPYVIGYATLAKRWNLPVSTIRDFCTFRTRIDIL